VAAVEALRAASRGRLSEEALPTNKTEAWRFTELSALLKTQLAPPAATAAAAELVALVRLPRLHPSQPSRPLRARFKVQNTL
jgi:hypothetical protein